MFTQAKVREQLLRYELVQLYTNRTDEKLQAAAEKNNELMTNRFRNSLLPLYVILEPTEKDYREVARTGGLLEVEPFLDFLGAPKIVDRIEFEAFVAPPEVKPGQTVQLIVKGKLKPGWHTYPITVRAPKQPTEQLSALTLIESDDTRAVWPLHESEPEWSATGPGGASLLHKKTFEWSQDVYISPEAKPGETPLAFSIKVQLGDDKSHATGTLYYSVPVTVKKDKAEAVTPQLKARLEQKQPAVEVKPLPPQLRSSLGSVGELVGKPPATDKMIDFDVSVTPGAARPGEVVKVVIKGTPKPGYHTYPITERSPKQAEDQLSSLSIADSNAFKPLWPIVESPAPVLVREETGDDLLEFKAPFIWTQEVLIPETAPRGEKDLTVGLRVQLCNDKGCTWGVYTFRTPITIKDEPAVAPSSEIKARSESTRPEIKVRTAESQSPSRGGGGSKTAEEGGLLAFVLTGAGWGLVSLVTPCVFPMIPITVSYFLKQSENKNARPTLLALIYSGTIIVVLTISAVALLSVFRAVITTASAQFAIGALFLFFALSLFGMYDIELPSGLARFTSAREGSGIVGTVFMALTFTIISFACVAPFLGGFGGTAVRANLGFEKILLGGLAFSVTFAFPFTLLALFPGLLKAMPKSGTWLNSVKVVMGFVELAAALKFFRTGELLISGDTHFLTHSFVMALYVAICVLCGLYLLNVYRLPHDTPLDNLGVMRVVLATLFLGLGVYLLPSLFPGGDGQTHRPRGVVFAWLDSFLLPDEAEATGTGGRSAARQGGPNGGPSLTWLRTLDQALEEAKKKPGARIFVDFTGVSCTNCKINEKDVFPQPKVHELLSRFIRVSLYTDIVPPQLYDQPVSASERRAEAARNLEMQKSQFQTEQLPYYVIGEVGPDGTFKTVKTYDEGKINKVDDFIAFLSENLGSAK